MIFYQLIRHCAQKHPYPPPENISKQVCWRYIAATFVRLYIILIFILFMVGLSAETCKAQNITITNTNENLRSIMTKIERQSGYDFWYNKGTINESEKITIDIKEKPLEAVLKIIFSPRQISFQIIDKTIFLKPLKIIYRDQPLQLGTNISGIITDEKQQPVADATIRVKNTNKIVVADGMGKFRISDAGEYGILMISSLGFKNGEVAFSSDKRFLEIILQSEENNLKEVEVVSTGYQSIPKERATGNFVQPIKEMFESRIAPDVLSKLNGITSGLIFNSNTSRTNSGQPDINIRGRSTIFANDQPLIILDNFPFTGDIRNINPNDVERITILKDAAAASIWGVRAGNGVIVINTKQGKMKQPLRIAFNSNITVSAKPNLAYNTNQLSSASFIDLETFLFNKGYYDNSLNDIINNPVISPIVDFLQQNKSGALSTAELSTRLTNYKNRDVNEQVLKNLYQNAIDQQYSLGLTGGSDNISYRFSVGYDRNIPPAKGNSYDRVTLNSVASFRPIKNLELDGSVNTILANSKSSAVLNQISIRLFPYDRLTDDEGNPLPISFGYSNKYLEESLLNGFMDWKYRPLQELDVQNNRTEERNIRLSTGAKYTMLKGLSAELKYLYQSFGAENRNLQSLSSYAVRNQINRYSVITNGKVSGYNFPVGATLGNADSKTTSNNYRAQMSYNYSSEAHEVSAIIGYELSETITKGNTSSLIGYDPETGTFANINTTTTYRLNPSGNGTLTNGLSLTGTINRLRSSFANASYGFKKRYTLSGSARIDGSNYFGVATNQKNVPLWSIGGKWHLMNEKFLNNNVFSKMDFRTTYGYNGNLDATVTGVTTFQYVNNSLWTNQVYATTSNIGNPDLRWERSAVLNIGVDLSSKNGKLSGSLDYFSRKGTDLIGFKNFVSSSGITTLKGNYSDMRGAGFDLTLKSQNINGPLSWSTTFLLSHVTDKVTRYDIVSPAAQVVTNSGTSASATPVVGNYLFGIYSYAWGGLNGQNGNPVGYFNGQSSEDYVSITTRTPVTDLVYSGSARPTYFGGLNNMFSYGPWSLAIQVNFKMGYYFRKPTINYSQIISGGTPYLNVNKDYDRRWQKPGDEALTSIPSMLYPFSETRDRFFQYAETNVERGDHIRLQDISIGYSFSQGHGKSFFLKNMQLSLYANNVGILWRANKSGLDPDAVPNNLDRRTIPPVRSIAVGLRGNF